MAGSTSSTKTKTLTSTLILTTTTLTSPLRSYSHNLTHGIPSHPSSWYLPQNIVPIQYSIPDRAASSQYERQTRPPPCHAIQWPQDSISDVFNRILTPGTSPIFNQSVVVDPDALLESLIVDNRQQRGSSRETTTSSSSWSSANFHKHYDPRSFLSYDTQMTIVSAVSTFTDAPPRVLVFGTGPDTPLLCAAVVAMERSGSVSFVEDDAHGARRARRQLSEQNMTATTGGDCHVWDVTYDTRVKDWSRWIGRERALADRLVRQFPMTLLECDVIVVNGPRGNEREEDAPGRMASLAAAAALLRGDGRSVVFVNDARGLVEMVFARYLFRPVLGLERHVRGWGTARNTMFFTGNVLFREIMGGAETNDVWDGEEAGDFGEFWRDSLANV